MSENKPISKMIKAELQEFLTQSGVAFTEENTVAELKELALKFSLKATLTEKGVAFTEENTVAELKELALKFSLKATLTEKGVAFTEENTLEELQDLLEEILATEATQAAAQAQAEAEASDDIVKVRNESSRIINGLHPWQIKEIKAENLDLYISYGCVKYTGQADVAVETKPSEEVVEKELPPHQR